jgi:hypothetical protein
MPIEPDYSVAWRDLAQRRLMMWVLLLGYVPGVALLCFLFAHYEPGLCTRIAMVWMLLMGVAIARAAWFRCPRCHGLFCFAPDHANRGGNSIYAQQCARCGLPIDDNPTRRTPLQ